MLESVVNKEFFKKFKVGAGKFVRTVTLVTLLSTSVVGCSLFPPTAPSSLKAYGAGQTEIALFWEDNSKNEDGFTISRTRPGCGFISIADVGENVNSYIDTELQMETNYMYRVAAYNKNGQSDWSNEATETTSDIFKIYPTDDTWAYEDDPDLNWGDDKYLMVASRNIYRSHWTPGKHTTYLKFSRMDLADLPSNANITEAYLWVLCSKNEIGRAEVSVGEVLEDWQEETLTWNNKPEERFFFVDKATVYHLGEWKNWDITSIVRAWYNRTSFDYGVYLAVTDNLTSEGRALLISKEDSSGKYSPYIGIEYLRY